MRLHLSLRSRKAIGFDGLNCEIWQLLAFLDSLQSTLRTSGFNETSVSEVMQAMQVLAKYNIMGLGLGLGVAAMAQLRGSESSNVQPSIMPSQRFDGSSATQNSGVDNSDRHFGSHTDVNKMLDDVLRWISDISCIYKLYAARSNRITPLFAASFPHKFVFFCGWLSLHIKIENHLENDGSSAAAAFFIDFIPKLKLCCSNSLGLNSLSGVGGVLIDVLSQSKVGGGAPSGPNFASTVIKEKLVDADHVELEVLLAYVAMILLFRVPDAIVGAVLGPKAKTLAEIQHLSGCKVEVHKRGPVAGQGNRLISLTGSADSIRNGRLMIEKVINDEQARRNQQGHHSRGSFI
ncbi:unnamed protein product [Dracunculus medinensis]|uniref:KH domain-containing protein n=1 Tax=Dracunculus medinensis TaxID=318479 RepID=A0A0N4U470_DRAME|nr:unnamed protein product [Dracunculus medinensis]